MILNSRYWDNRYKSNQIGWDLGVVSPPLKAYIDQLEDKGVKILIPGGGNSYEAEYLYNKGFQNVHVVDISEIALQNIKTRVPNFPDEQLLYANFFELDRSFDLIIEQTFFCALHPSLRSDYVNHMKHLLKEDGKFVGLLFDAPLNSDQPPFGGSKKDYLKLFESTFEILKMEPAFNSFKTRQGKELFIKMKKK